MKRLLLLAFAGLSFFVCCSGSDDDQTEEKNKAFVPDSFNGYFVEALASAYKTFEETDELPSYVNVEGINYNKSKYVAASCLLIGKMAGSPETWQEDRIDIPSVAGSVSDKNDTFDPDFISSEEVQWLASTILAYAESNGAFPNYCAFPTYYVESDGTKHENRLTFNNSAVIFCRYFSEYVKNLAFPGKVSSWQSDFLHKESNCETDNEVVVGTMNSIISGKTTTLAKAEALFNYSRDKWEWQDYPNTVKGSVKTINEKGGNCCDLSHALIAMSRAAGIPARYMHGQCQFSTSVIGHVFVELFVDGKWYICDPSNNNNTFGKHNWSHMATFNGRYKELPF